MAKEDKQNITVFIFSLAGILILVLVNKIFELLWPGMSIDESRNIMIKIFMVISTIIAGILVLCKKLSFSIECFKISKECNVKREIIEAVAVVLIFSAVLLGYRLYLNTKDPVLAARPLFALHLNRNLRWAYPLVALWQELLVKPLWQDNVKTALGGRKWLTLIYIGLLFGILHMNYPIYMVLGAGVMCFVTGILYERDRNIWGVWFMHFCFGFLPTSFVM